MMRYYFFKILLIVMMLILPFTLNGRAGQKSIKYKPDWTDKVRYETRAVKRIDAKAAFYLFSTGKALLISVDDKEYYKKMTAFLGSFNIPSSRFLHSKRKIKLPRNKLILMY